MVREKPLRAQGAWPHQPRNSAKFQTVPRARQTWAAARRKDATTPEGDCLQSARAYGKEMARIGIAISTILKYVT